MKNRNKVLLLGTAGCFALSLTSVAIAAAVDGPAFITAADVAVRVIILRHEQLDTNPNQQNGTN